MINDIKKQLIRLYDGDPWYGPSIRSVFESISEEYLFESPDKSTHSIAELVAHMITWRTFALAKLGERPTALPDQEQTFNWRLLAKKKKNAWEILQHTFDANQLELLQLLSRQQDAILSEEVPGKPYSFQYLLQGIIHHDVYHLGQIVYIQRLLGKENQDLSTAGFLTYSYRIFPFKNLALQK